MQLRRHPLPGTDLTLSTFCCGLGDLFALPLTESDALLDLFIAAGGNFFDSAHCYSFWLPGGNGLSEISIGDYLRRRGIKDAVVATKGGHPGNPGYRSVDCYLSPERIAADIDDSLGRLQCAAIDLYYLHRDDPRVPAAEIIETLNCEIARGRIRHLGASNWSTKRINEANDHASAKNLRPFVISEPAWSLAAWIKSPDATMVEYGPAEIAWHRQTGLAVAPYSPTAQGFFAGESPRSDGAYGTAANRARRDRANKLAAKLGATPAQIALAWLTNQPFPVFPILGSKNHQRLTEALGADIIKLSPADLTYLEHGAAATGGPQ